MNPTCDTSLHESVVVNKIEKLKTLLFTDKLDVNAEDQNGCTAMYHAVSLKNLDATKLLVLAGADVNTKVEMDYFMNHCIHTALYVAIEADDAEQVKFLVSQGADVNERCGPANDTPLIVATNSSNVQYDIIEVLLQSGVDANAQNDHSKTPLHLAAENADVKTAMLLLSHNASPNVADMH